MTVARLQAARGYLEPDHGTRPGRPPGATCRGPTTRSRRRVKESCRTTSCPRSPRTTARNPWAATGRSVAWWPTTSGRCCGPGPNSIEVRLRRAAEPRTLLLGSPAGARRLGADWPTGRGVGSSPGRRPAGLRAVQDGQGAVGATPAPARRSGRPACSASPGPRPLYRGVAHDPSQLFFEKLGWVIGSVGANLAARAGWRSGVEAWRAARSGGRGACGGRRNGSACVPALAPADRGARRGPGDGGFVVRAARGDPFPPAEGLASDLAAGGGLARYCSPGPLLAMAAGRGSACRGRAPGILLGGNSPGGLRGPADLQARLPAARRRRVRLLPGGRRHRRGGNTFVRPAGRLLHPEPILPLSRRRHRLALRREPLVDAACPPRCSAWQPRSSSTGSP